MLDSTKVSPYRDVNGEGVGKEDQLALDVKGLNLNDQATGKKAQTFTFEELSVATGNFRSDCFLGEGGFGKVFKGTLEKQDQVVAIKQLDHLPSGKKTLDWNTRMKIAAGAARGLEYLHDRMKPPVIYRDLKCSNILLGEDYQPKLSDFGLAKVGPSGDKTHVSTRVMGTYGYCAPDYAMTGQLTFKSDIYSFGVVLLELITGRKAIDNTKARKDQNLVGWARPLFKDRRNFPKMVDPLLQGQYPVRGLYQALAISAMCVQEQPSMRPVVSDVVLALNFLASSKYDPNSPSSSSRRNTSFRRDIDDEEKRPELVKETESDDYKPLRNDTDQSTLHKSLLSSFSLYWIVRLLREKTTMTERSFSQLPISSSHGGRRTLNTRRGIFPVSEYWIHAIPVIIFVCFFTLWFFSHSVSLDMNDGETMSVHRLEKSMAVRNESHVSLAILASSAVSPVSANQNLTAHHQNATQSHNATDKPELRNWQEKGKKGKKVTKSKVRKERSEKEIRKLPSVVKAKQPLAG
ncbi:unnamed protein product [Thlaspi arvense]|uniref:Protein kinase domain-containing protein n=1 Tax=Thlaspi arvense TaxID=13288 RepID=A0AAU9RDB9_THLAR|nr:unnamed protein product [Thlaspi arvense]